MSRRRQGPAGGFEEGGALTCPTADTIELGGVRLELSSQQVSVEGRSLRFSGPQFRLLKCLMLQPGQVVSHQELLRAVPLGDPPALSKLYAQIAVMRDRLGPVHREQIQTVYRSGFCFQPDPALAGARRHVPARSRPASGSASLPLNEPGRRAVPVAARRLGEKAPGRVSPARWSWSRSLARRLPDAVWVLFEPVLPPAPPAPAARAGVSNHRTLHALIYLLVAGIGWRQVPSCFPPGEVIRARLGTWLGAPAFHEAWSGLGSRYPQFQGVNWEVVSREDWDGRR